MIITCKFKNKRNSLGHIIFNDVNLLSKYIYQYFLEKHFHNIFSSFQVNEDAFTKMSDYYRISRNFKGIESYKSKIINEINSNYYSSVEIDKSVDKLMSHWKKNYSNKNLKSAASKFIYIIYADIPPYDDINRKALNDIYNYNKSHDYNYYEYKNKFLELTNKIEKDLLVFKTLITKYFINIRLLFKNADIDSSIFRIKFTDFILQEYESYELIKDTLKSRFGAQ